MIILAFWSFILFAKLSISISLSKKSLKWMKYEAWQVLEYFVSNIASFLKEWREVLAGAMLRLNNIEWLALLVRSNLIMSVQKKKQHLRRSDPPKSFAYPRTHRTSTYTFEVGIIGKYWKKESSEFWAETSTNQDPFFQTVKAFSTGLRPEARSCNPE